MPNYAGQTRILAAVDCIIFGFDGENLKVLLMKRGMEPEKNKWSLIGNFLTESESLEQAAIRVLKKIYRYRRIVYASVAHVQPSRP